MLRVTIITNNPKVEQQEGALYYDETLMQILLRVRDLVHQNYRLLTHPLAGSIKPHQTPYKSVALFATPGAELDFDSLSAIEGAIQVTQKLMQEHHLPEWPKQIMADFALIDLDLLQSGLQSVGHL